MPNQAHDVLLHTMSGTELSHVRTELQRRRVRTSIPPHPVQANRQTSPHRDLGNALVPAHRQVHVATSPLRVDSCCRLCRLHQQESQQRISLLADVSQPLLASAGVLARNHPHIRADLLATMKPLRRSDDQHVRQCRQRAHTRMGHQADYLGPLPGFLLGSSREFLDRRMQSIQQLQQLLPSPAGPRSQRQLLQLGSPSFAPQLGLPAPALVHGQRLQLIHDPRAHLHQAMPMPQQLPQILDSPDSASPDPRGKLPSRISRSRSCASLRSVFCFFTRLALISLAGSPIHSWKPSSASSRSNQREYPGVGLHSLPARRFLAASGPDRNLSACPSLWFSSCSPHSPVSSTKNAIV